MRTFLTILFLTIFLSVLFAQENGGPYTPDENTVLLMHFDGDATNSANFGSDGIEHGSGVSFEDGVHGQCLRLDNSTWAKQNWIEVPYFDGLNASADGLAVECWFKLNSWGENSTGTRSLFRKDGADWAADYEIILWPEGNEGRHGQVNLDCEDEEDRAWGADAPIADILELNTWYYIVIYYNPYFIHEYVNEEGEQRQASSVYCLIRDENFEEIFASRGHTETPPTNSEGLFRIGFGGSGDSCFDGWIDELRISNSYRKYRDDVLKDVDIDSFKDSVFIPIDKWLSYGWPFGEFYPKDPETGEVVRKNSCGPMMLSRAIHFWEHPRFPSGEIEHNMHGLDWYANYDETEYLWDIIYDEYSVDATEKEYAPAALFTAQVGVASRKTYDNMYCMPKFLKENFHFSEKTRLVFEEEHTKEDWENIIRNELNNGRICMVGGWGHYYIINGYNSKNEFYTDYSMDAYYWNDIKEYDYGAMQDMIIYFEPDWQGKTLTLDYPKEDEYFQKQSQVEIKWTSSNINSVLLEYSTDAGKNWQGIENNVDASEGKYTWSVPETASKEYKVRISDSSDGNIYRRSNTFEVFNKQEIAFEYPINNTYFQAGSNQPLYWSSEGVKAFKLEYSTDGENWTLLEDSIVSALGRYEIRIPQLESETVRLKATNIDDESIFVISEIFKVKGNGLLGGPFIQDENAVLLMHFEENLKNNAPNNLQAFEANSSGTYIENYAQHLGKAFQLNNDETLNNFLIVPHESELDLTGSWTIEMWFNTNSLNAVLINKPSDTGENYNVHIEGDGHMEARFYDSDGVRHQIGTPSATIQTNKLYHITFTNDISLHSLELTIRNEDVNVIFNQTLSYPAGSIPGTGTGDLTIGNLVDGYIDELRILKTAISHTETAVLNTSLVTNFSCYPNPVTNESIISFQTKTSGNVNLSVLDIQGRKIATLLNEKLHVGRHTIPVSNSLPSSGIYFCKLQTSEGILTKKLIINAK